MPCRRDASTRVPGVRDCFGHMDELRNQGVLIESRMLDLPATAKSLRVRKGRSQATDGPFAEAKEVLGEASTWIEAQGHERGRSRSTSGSPWSAIGCVEVRPVQDLDAVRQRVGHAAVSA